MSTQPIPNDVATAPAWAANRLADIQAANTRIIAGYRTAFANYLVELQQNAQAVAPTPPQIAIFNVAIAEQLYEAFGEALQANIGTSDPNPTLSLDQAITWVQLAPMQAPPPPVQATSDPVGPYEYTDAIGQAHYFNVYAEAMANYPNGMRLPLPASPAHPAGTFVHNVIQTLVGQESDWILLPQAPASLSS